MTPRTHRTRVVAGLVVGVAALGLAVLGVAAVWGTAVEYAAGTQLLFLAVTMPSAVLALALLTWPGLSGRVVLAVTLGGVVVLLGVTLVADQLGLREREQRALAASAAIGCNGPNSEVRVDARVDEVFRELPRPTPLYGPVEGDRHGCGAGVGGDADAFDAWARALRDLDGWQVVHDRRGGLVLRRGDGITLTLRDGDVPILTVSTREGPDRADRPSQEGVVGGSNVASAWSPASRNPTDR